MTSRLSEQLDHSRARVRELEAALAQEVARSERLAREAESNAKLAATHAADLEALRERIAAAAGSLRNLLTGGTR